MRILHVTDCYLPHVGGIELHVRDLVARQRVAGDDARVVTLTPVSADAAPDPHWISRVPGREPAGAPGLRQAAAHLDRVLRGERIDVLHVHLSVYSPFAILAVRQAASRSLPTLVTVHSMLSALGPVPNVASQLLGLRRWQVVWSAVSERAAEPLRAMLGAGTDVHVLGNAVEPGEWRSELPTFAEERPEATPLTVISVMRLTRVKRTLPLARILHDVRRAVPNHVPVRAVVVGAGPRRTALERYLRVHDLDDWVELPGCLDRSRIRDELRRAAVFLAPAERESFGIAPLEARTVGLPVVASSRSGVREFVEPGVNGLLGGTDRELANLVVRLLTDDVLRARIARHNRLVPPAHDWAAVISRADQLYDEARARVAGLAFLVPS